METAKLMSVRNKTAKRSTKMIHPPTMRELQPLIRAKGREADPASRQWSWLKAAMANPDLVAVVIFCLIGLLLALNVMLRFPDFGAVIEQYNLM
jgi:hypothetical protein